METLPRGRILVVDDEKILADTLKKAIELRVWSDGPIDVLYNSQDALRYLEENSRLVLVAILDLYISREFDGLEIAEKLRSKNSRGKIIMISGYFDEGNGRAEEIKKTVDVFLAKPFDLHVLLGFINNFLSSDDVNHLRKEHEDV